MPEYTLSLPAARLVQTHTLGLAQGPTQPAQKSDVEAVIRNLGLLQIDTIHIVARSPYLALFSRLGSYPSVWLDELLAEGRIFEYWAHAACFLPIDDYPLHRSLCLAGAQGWFSDAWYHNNREAIDGVLEHIRQHGAARSIDFERQDGKSGTWWDWKIEKQALEFWFARGVLMSARRHNFQRVYDLRERVLPDWDDSKAPAAAQTETELALRSVRALGLARPEWVADYFRRSRRDTPALVRSLARDGRLIEVAVEGWDTPYVAHPDRRECLARAEAGRLSAVRTTLLTPFDPLVWDRTRARELFNFDYTIECYLPAAKRKYGYFILPILHKGELVGRLDAKAHRKEKRFEVIALYLEPGTDPSAELAADIAAALRECAGWHAAPEVTLGRVDPPIFGDLLQAALTG
jgi:hypothetical protein